MGVDVGLRKGRPPLTTQNNPADAVVREGDSKLRTNEHRSANIITIITTLFCSCLAGWPTYNVFLAFSPVSKNYDEKYISIRTNAGQILKLF